MAVQNMDQSRGELCPTLCQLQLGRLNESQGIPPPPMAGSCDELKADQTDKMTAQNPTPDNENAPRKPSLRLHLLLYPFSAAAVAINLFLLFLMLQALGIPAMPPIIALWLSIPLGIPATWLTARWVQGLIDEAEGRK